MKVRWIRNDPFTDPSIIARSIIAERWLGKYYLVSTVMVDGSDSFSQMVGIFRAGRKFRDVDDAKYVTQVFRSDKYGVVGKKENPLYQAVYQSISEAMLGHKETIDLITSQNLL
jgi:hypothetical protein